MQKLSTSAECSKAIREELKKRFPRAKFKVHSEGRVAVNIYYVDGPAYDEVKKVIGKYEMGHFDGMTDIYEYDNKRDDIPQVNYVFLSREISLEHGQEVLDEFNKYWDRENKPNIYNSYFFNVPVINGIQDLDWNPRWMDFVREYNFSNE